MRTKLVNLLGIFVILSMLVVTPAAAATSSAPSAQTISVKDKLTVEFAGSDVSLKNAIRTADGKVRVIVQLAQPPLALYSGGIADLAPTTPSAIGKTKLDVNSPASQAYIANLRGVQVAFWNQVLAVAPGAQKYLDYQVAFNGLSLAVAPDQVAAVSALPGVLKVYPDQIREVQMDASLPLINAPAMWQQLGGMENAGKGIKVADVDTGLRPANPMFSGTGFTAPVGYPKGYCADNPTDPDFQCNGKVIAARVFVDPALPVAVEEVATPLDIGGHGTHTAGTAAGNQVTVAAGTGAPVDTVISGVAPGAYLMVYKALFEKPDHSGSSGTDSSLIGALNAALSDGADVINNSWGGGAGDPNSSVYKPLIDAITAAGTLVVFSAGNDGDGAGTIGCPGCVESALTVAASTTARTYKADLVEVSVSDPAVVVPPAVKTITGRSVATSAVQAQIVDLEVEGVTDAIACTGPVSSAIATGKIVVVKRGTCALVDKVVNAQSGGAVGVVIRNVTGGASTLPLISPVLPTVHISAADGNALTAFLTTVKAAAATATYKINVAQLDPNGDQADVVASFSSRGPNGDGNALKPDITAPGVNILSAVSPALMPGGTDPVYDFYQGTSMSAPHITGSAALVMQLHPTWTPAQVKTALTSTSVQSLTKSNGTTPADPFDMGAGRVDLARVIKAGVTFAKPSFASKNCVISCSWTNTIKNVSNTTETWTANLVAAATMGLSVTPTSFTLAPGLSGEFTVTVDAHLMSTSAYQFGSITWKNASMTYTDAYMPVAVKAGTATNSVSLTNTVDKAVANSGDVLTYTLTVGNQYVSPATFTVTNPIPANAVYVDGSATGGLVYNAVTNTLQGNVTLPGLQANVAPTGAPTGFVAHTVDPLNDLILSDYCDSPCDDDAFNISGMDFYYMGVHYTSMGVSSNGFLQPGGATSATASNQMLPDPGAPNNVIAPLWTDLVMMGNGVGDPATGIWLLWGTPTHTVFEWQNAQQYGAPTATYTFQVWIEDGTNNITFAYGNLTGSLTAYNYTVGMENANGTAGSSYYYSDGATAVGTAPAVGTDLKVNNSFATATMQFQLEAAWNDMSSRMIYDVATLKNNLNVDEATAVAKTRLVIYDYRFPLVSKPAP